MLNDYPIMLVLVYAAQVKNSAELSVLDFTLAGDQKFIYPPQYELPLQTNYILKLDIQAEFWDTLRHEKHFFISFLIKL